MHVVNQVAKVESCQVSVNKQLELINNSLNLTGPDGKQLDLLGSHRHTARS